MKSERERNGIIYRQFCGVGAAPPIFRGAINEQSNSDLLLGFTFVSLPFEFFQKRAPQKVGDANKFMPRCALNLEEHGVRYAGLDRSAVGSRKYFTALALFSKGVGLRFLEHSPSIIAFAAVERYDCRHRSAVPELLHFLDDAP
jgi:hypothetical protein